MYHANWLTQTPTSLSACDFYGLADEDDVMAVSILEQENMKVQIIEIDMFLVLQYINDIIQWSHGSHSAFRPSDIGNKNGDRDWIKIVNPNKMEMAEENLKLEISCTI